MTNILSRLFAPFLAVALLDLLAACEDSGHSLGTSRAHDAGAGGAPVGTGGSSSGSGGVANTSTGGNTAAGGTTFGTTSAGGSKGTGGSAGGGSTSTGGAGGGVGGRGGSSTADDAGQRCANRGESCASQSCCSPLICLSLTSPTTCYESYPPPRDDAAAGDTRSADSGCPSCPPMKCAYGSPVDSNGCTVCECNPAPDGSVDTPAVCPLPEGCSDAASTACPSTPPAKDTACVGQEVCSYEDCPGSGHTQASCRSGKWALSTGACGTVICLGVSTGTTCTPGQVCLVRAGGALLVSCIDNPCGAGLVSTECSSVTAGCTPIFSTTSGLTYYCNTCVGDGTCA